MARPNKKVTKPSDRGRVVCVKFPAQSVDEAYLQACIEPFGKMGKILMFPSVAFVELGTAEQAKDLVKFYTNLDPAENKRQLDFSISNTFSFLQSSQVVSFTPAPSGRDGRSDLISIIKRFGEPLYSLFLPSKAFVEMKLPADAKKLVDYYSSNVLKLNDDAISVSFSTEYKTLMRVSLATRCDEEATETVASSTGEPSSEQRTRSESRDGFRSTGRPRNRSRSRDRSKGRSGRGSRSRDRSRREGRSRSREKKKDKSSRDTKSKSEERSSSSATGQNQTKEEKEEPKKPEEPVKTEPPEKPEEPEGSEKTEEPEEPEKTEEPEEPNESMEPEEPGADTRSAGEPEEDSGPGADEEQLHDEQKFSAEDSDIEGMEVIAEDGEKLKDEDAKSQEESREETNHPEEAAASPEGGDDNEVKSMEIDEEEEEVKNEEAEEEERSRVKSEEEEHEAADTEDDEELGFPVDLENCITLDEVDCEDEGEADQGDGSEPSEPSRVLFFSTMPEDYTDMDFIQVMRGLGTVVRYLLMNDRQQGFVEMRTPSEAQKAVEVLESEPVHINGTRLMGHLSQEYSRLTDGWAVPSDEDQETKTSTDRPPELETSGTFQETDETSELETSGTFQEKMDETSELETSGTFQEEKTDETPENRSVRRTRSKKVPQTTSDRKTRSKKIPNKENSEKTPQRRTRSKMNPEETTEVSENVSETSPDTKTSVEETEETSSSSKTCEELRTTSEKEPTGRKAVKGKTTSRKSPETRTDKRRGTPEDTVPLKTMKTEAGEPPEDTNRPKDGREKSTVETKPEPEVKESEDLDHPEPPEQDSEMEHQPAPAEPEKPSKPVGPEFVRPVVGYFCNLCQLIFIDEDEAKLQHCSTLEHYRKYQEKTGKDPWSS